MFDGEHPPITTEFLGALHEARLDQRDWQVLLDDGTITLQIPEVFRTGNRSKNRFKKSPNPLPEKGIWNNRRNKRTNGDFWKNCFRKDLERHEALPERVRIGFVSRYKRC